MNSGGVIADDAEYHRLSAKQFLAEAKREFLQKPIPGTPPPWRACVACAQMAMEHAVKAILATQGPPPRTHDPTRHLSKLLRANQENMTERVRALLMEMECLLSQINLADLHIQSDYGEINQYGEHILPWQIFSKEHAQKALKLAEHVVSLMEKVLPLLLQMDSSVSSREEGAKGN